MHMRLIFQRSSIAPEVSVDAVLQRARPENEVASTDRAMLARYAETGSEDAFAQIVCRHAGWIYNTCRRSLHDSHLAEDATQAVFLLLSRKAGSLKPSTHVAGWLFQTCRYVLADLRKNRARYKHRQEIARDMSLRRFFDAESGQSSPDPQLLAALDEAISRLRDGDRQVILMHFYEGLTVHQIGEQLGLSSEAAKKRITRALARLRNQFGGNGQLAAARTVAVPATALAALLYAAAAKAAPVGLAAAVVKATTVPGLSSLIADMIVAGVRQATMHATGKLLAALAVTAAPLAVVVAVKGPAHPDPKPTVPMLAAAPSPRFASATPIPQRQQLAPVSEVPATVRSSYGMPWVSQARSVLIASAPPVNLNASVVTVPQHEFHSPSSTSPMSAAAAAPMAHASVKSAARLRSPASLLAAPGGSYAADRPALPTESATHDRDRHAEQQITADVPGSSGPTMPSDASPSRLNSTANAAACPAPWADGMLRHPGEPKFVPLDPENPQPRDFHFIGAPFANQFVQPPALHLAMADLSTPAPLRDARFMIAAHADQLGQPAVLRLTAGLELGWQGRAVDISSLSCREPLLSDHHDALAELPPGSALPTDPQLASALANNGDGWADLLPPGFEHHGLTFGRPRALRDSIDAAGNLGPPEMSAFSLATDDPGEPAGVGFSVLIPEPASGIWSLLAAGFLLHRRRTRGHATART